jgi:circadian clock protein KaiC
LLNHLRSYRFFAPDLIGSAVHVFSLQQFLTQGTPPTIQDIQTLVRQTQANIVVMDGFQSIRDTEPNSQASRQLLYDLGTGLSLLGITTLLTTEADPRDPAIFPDMTTADVLIGLYFRLRGVRAQRSLEIIKVRGQGPLLGQHSLTLSDDGMYIFPRTESRIRRSTPEMRGVDVTSPALPERVLFGLPALDEALGGGLTSQTSTLLTGSLGTGKTLLALQFALVGVSRGEPAVILSFRENQEQLIRKSGDFGFAKQLHAALVSEKLTIQHWEPVELDPDQIATRLLATTERVKARRVVIDNITELERAVKERGEPERIPSYQAALLTILQSYEVTSLVIQELYKGFATSLDYSVDDLSIMADNVIVVQQLVYHNRIHRVLSILKMRFSAHDYAFRELLITSPEGIRVLTPEESGTEGWTAHETGVNRLSSQPSSERKP